MTFDKVKEIVLNCLKCDEGDITLEADLTNDLGADSLDAVDLIMELEDAFGISFPEDAAIKIKTVGDIVAYIDGVA
ncbi:MAG: acyl carrier protein [Oscillospiraceae bacterium]|nr:acyl carrier protein [Oscillospiraceae bacterium]MDD3833767.1 acyl carrier protein [Oscillospiraceae bacterium]